MSTSSKMLIVFGGVSILLLLIAFIAYPIFRSEPEPEPQDVTPVEITPSELTPLPSDQERVNPSDTFVVPLEEEPISSEASQRAEVERLSRYFVERFGSYSNFSGFANITSLEALMTESMRQYAASVIEQADQQQSGYYGVTTRLVSVNITDFSSRQQADVSIIVQQETQNGLNAESVSQVKDGTLELVFRDGEWLVNGLYYR